MRNYGELNMKDKMLFLAGQRFGRLTAIRCTDETHNNGYIWECLCDCGKTVFLPTSKFKGPKGVRSCGCLLQDFYKSIRVDITGRTFYRLTAIKCTDERDRLKNILWLFKCSCGNEFKAAGSEVMRGQIRSCGCITKSKPLQLEGQRFGRLIVIKKTGEKNDKRQFLWECDCDCGGKTVVSGFYLKTGGVRSCGCLKKETHENKRLNITGMTFGRLTAIKPIGRRNKKNNILWLFKCECGNDVVCSASRVKEGTTKSCGCLKLDKAADGIVEKRNKILCVEGTCINSIASTKIPKNNTSGVTGVFWNKKSKKWAAQIRFKGKSYFLGYFFNLSEAEASRKDAEKKYFKPMIEKYKDEMVEYKQRRV